MMAEKIICDPSMEQESVVPLAQTDCSIDQPVPDTNVKSEECLNGPYSASEKSSEPTVSNSETGAAEGAYPPLKLHIKLKPDVIRGFKRRLEKKLQAGVGRAVSADPGIIDTKPKTFYCQACDLHFSSVRLFESHLVKGHIEQEASPVVLLKRLPIPLEVLRKVQQRYSSQTFAEAPQTVEDQWNSLLETLGGKVPLNPVASSLVTWPSTDTDNMATQDMSAEMYDKRLMEELNVHIRNLSESIMAMPSVTGETQNQHSEHRASTSTFSTHAPQQPSSQSGPTTSCADSAPIERCESVMIIEKDTNAPRNPLPPPPLTASTTEAATSSAFPSCSVITNTPRMPPPLKRCVPTAAGTSSDHLTMLNQMNPSAMAPKNPVVAAVYDGHITDGNSNNGGPNGRPNSVIVLESNVPGSLPNCAPARNMGSHEPWKNVPPSTTVAPNQVCPPPVASSNYSNPQMAAIPQSQGPGPSQGSNIAYPPHVHQDPASRCMCLTCRDIRTGDLLRTSQIRLPDGRFEYACPVCTRRFSHPTSLIRHCRSVNHGYVCDMCSNGFMNEVTFQTHKRLHLLKGFPSQLTTGVPLQRLLLPGSSATGGGGSGAVMSQTNTQPQQQMTSRQPPPLVAAPYLNRPPQASVVVPTNPNLNQRVVGNLGTANKRSNCSQDDDVIVVGMECRQGTQNRPSAGTLPPPPPLDRRLQQPHQQGHGMHAPQQHGQMASTSVATQSGSNGYLLQQLQGRGTTVQAQPQTQPQAQLARMLRNSEITLTPIGKENAPSANSKPNSAVVIRPISNVNAAQQGMPNQGINAQNTSMTRVNSGMVPRPNIPNGSFVAGGGGVRPSAYRPTASAGMDQQSRSVAAGSLPSTVTAYRMLPNNPVMRQPNVAQASAAAVRDNRQRPIPAWHHPVAPPTSSQTSRANLGSAHQPQHQQQYGSYGIQRTSNQPPPLVASVPSNQYPVRPQQLSASLRPHPLYHAQHQSGTNQAFVGGQQQQQQLHPTTMTHSTQYQTSHTNAGSSSNAVAQNQLRCHLCRIVFPTVQACQAHVTAVHLPQKPAFTCRRCRKMYLNESSLLRHEAICTTKVLCMKCNQRFFRDELMNHYAQVHYGGLPSSYSSNAAAAASMAATRAVTMTTSGHMLPAAATVDKCSSSGGSCLQPTSIVSIVSTSGPSSLGNGGPAGSASATEPTVIDIDIEILPISDAGMPKIVSVTGNATDAAQVPQNENDSSESGHAEISAETDNDVAILEVQSEAPKTTAGTVAANNSDHEANGSKSASPLMVNDGDVEMTEPSLEVSEMSDDMTFPIIQDVVSLLDTADGEACKDPDEEVEKTVTQDVLDVVEMAVATVAESSSIADDVHIGSSAEVVDQTFADQRPPTSGLADDASSQSNGHAKDGAGGETTLIIDMVDDCVSKVPVINIEPMLVNDPEDEGHRRDVPEILSSETTDAMEVDSDDKADRGCEDIVAIDPVDTIHLVPDNEVVAKSQKIEAECPSDEQKSEVTAAAAQPQCVCPICDQTFDSQNLMDHLSIHRRISECRFCSEKFPSKKQLQSHLRTHLRSCRELPLSFKKLRRRPLSSSRRHRLNSDNSGSSSTVTGKKSELVVALMDMRKVMENVEFLRRMGVVGLVTLSDMQTLLTRGSDLSIDKFVNDHLNGVPIINLDDENPKTD